MEKINKAKRRLLELETEETEMLRRLEQLAETDKYSLPRPAFIIAIDLLIGVTILTAILYHLWSREYPDKLNSVLILIGIALTGLDLYRMQKKHRAQRTKMRIEKRLEQISRERAKAEKIIDSAGNFQETF